MARTTGRQSLKDLLDAGALKAGEELVVNRRSAPSIVGTLQADGQIKVHGGMYSTPTAAAREALNVGTVDGWIRWRVPRLGDKTLAEIRDERQRAGV